MCGLRGRAHGDISGDGHGQNTSAQCPQHHQQVSERLENDIQRGVHVHLGWFTQRTWSVCRQKGEFWLQDRIYHLIVEFYVLLVVVFLSNLSYYKTRGLCKCLHTESNIEGSRRFWLHVGLSGEMIFSLLPNKIRSYSWRYSCLDFMSSWLSSMI